MAGADHIVIFATTRDEHEIVVKAGLETNVDAFVLRQLAGTPVPVPTLLGHGSIEHDGEQYWLTIMTPAPGALLADIADMAEYMQPLVSAVRDVHQVTTTKGAGLVLAVEEGKGQSWHKYLDSLLSGSHPDFHWGP
jgi:hypothetical protein